MAAALSEVEIYTSRQAPGQATDVEARFETNDAVNAPSDTIVLTIPSGFSMNGLTIASLIFSHGPTTGRETTEILAASASAGVWGASISGNVITLTAPTDAGSTEIAIGEKVSLRFGNQFNGGAQILNPGTEGLHQWTINGSFGGTAYPFTPIVNSAEGGFTVSFTVPEQPITPPPPSGGGAGGAGSPPPSGFPTPPTEPPVVTPPPTEPPPTEPPVTPPVTPPTTPTQPPFTPPTTNPPTTPTNPPTRPPTTGGGATGSTGGSGSSGSGTTSTIPTAPTSTTPVTPTSTEPILVPIVPTTPVQPTSTTPTLPTNPVRQGVITWTLSGSVTARNPGTIRFYTNDAADLEWAGLMSGTVASLEIASQRYILNSQPGRSYLRFSAASQPGTVQAILRAQAPNQAAYTQNLTLEQGTPFRVVGETRDGQKAPLEGGEIQLSRRQGTAWKTLQTIKTGSDGLLRIYLAAGTYRLEGKKDGYQTQRTELTVPDGALFGELVLKEAGLNPLAAIDPNASLGENIANVAGATVEAISQLVQDIRTPEAQAVAEVTAPVAVVASVGATAAAASSINFLNYLRFLFTQPLLLIRRRKREKWGLVYNSITKQPIDLAVVRLLEARTGTVKQTRITDAQGRFAFLVGPGQYRLQVVKPSFVFPSLLLAKETIDVDLVDLYHGEAVQVTGSATLTPNIPLDPTEKMETPQTILHKQRWRKVQQVISVGGLLVSGIAYVLQPTTLVAVLGVAQLASFFLFRRLAIPRKPKNWGIAYDGQTRKPLGQTIVRIFDKKYNKLLETQLTDKDGKYAFFAGKNVYYVTADREGYERATSKELDLTKESLGVVHEPIALVPKNASSPSA